jgi:hypothetical protein
MKSFNRNRLQQLIENKNTVQESKGIPKRKQKHIIVRIIISN